MKSVHRMKFEELKDEYDRHWRSRHESTDDKEAYDFNIKIRKVWIPEKVRSAYTEKEIQEKYDERARVAFEDFSDFIRNDYEWIGAISQQGRSGGWMVIETEDPAFTGDQPLRVPRKRIMALRQIYEDLQKAKKDFVKELEDEKFWEISPRDWSPRWKKK